MPMRDYEDLKNIDIPVEQQTMVKIMDYAWQECNGIECSVCLDRNHSSIGGKSCIVFKYARKLYEAGFRQTEEGEQE